MFGARTASTGLLRAASVPGQYSGLPSDLRPGPAAVPRDRSPLHLPLTCQPRRQPPCQTPQYIRTIPISDFAGDRHAAEDPSRTDRTRSPGARHRQRGRGFPHLPDLRRPACASPIRIPPACSTRWPRRSAAIAPCSTRCTARSFGEHLPPIRREDVKGFLKRRPIWLTKNLPVDKMRQEAEIMEMQAAKFYDKAASRRSTSTCANS